jgi:hypothetical protein
MPSISGCKFEIVDDFEEYTSLPGDDYSDRKGTISLLTGSVAPVTFGIVIPEKDQGSKKTAAGVDEDDDLSQPTAVASSVV